MRSLPFLLIAGLALVLMAGEADADMKEPEWSYKAEDDYEQMQKVSISANGEHIVACSGNYNGKVYFFEKDNSTPLWNYSTESDAAAIAISADGEYIAASCSSDGKIYLFHKDNGTPLWSYTASSYPSVAISADGEYIAVAGSNEVHLFNRDNSTPLWSYTASSGYPSVAISADGGYIAVGGLGTGIKLFHKDNGTPLWSYSIDYMESVAISADGEYIASCSSDDEIYLFDKDSSTPLWSYTAGSYVYSVDISADGEYIAAGTSDHGVWLFDNDGSNIDNKQPLWNYATGREVKSAAISADGEYIVAGSGHRILLFDKNSSTPLWSYIIAEDDALSVAISADGQYIVAGSDDSKVHIFNKSAPPTANIDSIEPASIRFDEEVTFTGSGTDRDGTIVAYEWTSDIDGFLSDEKEFSKIGFTAAYGSYSNGDIFICNNGQTNCYQTISFRVQDNDGDWSSWSTTEMWVYPNKPPFATIDSIAPSPAEKGWTVSFSGTGSDSDGTIVGYLWESSIDGELSTEANFNSNSLSPGHHSITFRVQDSDGDWNDANLESLWIYALPVAIAGDDITVNSGDDNVKFRGQGTDEDGNIALYEWDFDGDGIYDWSSSENGRTIYIYNNEGTFTAVLRVTDNDSFTSTDHLVVTIGRSSGEDDDDDSLLAPSLAASVAAVAVIALRRRY